MCVCSVISDSLQLHGLKLIRLLCLWNFPGTNTGAGCHFLPQGIFPTQGSNLHLLRLWHWQADCSPLRCWKQHNCSLHGSHSNNCFLHGSYSSCIPVDLHSKHVQFVTELKTTGVSYTFLELFLCVGSFSWILCLSHHAVKILFLQLSEIVILCLLSLSLCPCLERASRQEPAECNCDTHLFLFSQSCTTESKCLETVVSYIFQFYLHLCIFLI